MARFSRFSRKPRFRRFRRKGSKGTWFPVGGTIWEGEGGEAYYDATASAQLEPVPIARSTGPFLVTFPLTLDYTFQGDQYSPANPGQNPSLRDFVEGQDYILRSIVGNLFIYAVGDRRPNTDAYNRSEYWQYFQAAAGFFVARANDVDPTLPDLTTGEIDPINAKNIQDPWIWRRQWLFQNPRAGELANLGTISANTFIRPTALFADNNVNMSGLSGPHFQTKSARRIRREERLWCSIAVMGWDGILTDVMGSADQGGIKFMLDYRIFGKMVKGRNASAF